MTARKRCLVVGGGGREHAIALALARSHAFETVYVAPGNAGTALEPGICNLPVTNIETLALFARRENLAFTVVGPEAPLAKGIVDAFRKQGLPIFGPTQAAAQLEASKDFAKAFMKRHGIPTATYETFTDPAAAKDYITRQGAPIVVKADGLAAGKGVVVAQTVAEAHAAVDQFLGDDFTGGSKDGKDTARVVVEAFLTGEEASFIVMADGRNVLALATSQDHKRLLNGDQGPNTGGMGAYSPLSWAPADLTEQVVREVAQPVVDEMARRGAGFIGLLYCGLALTSRGLRVVEFNVRFGDPETQAVLARLTSSLPELLHAAATGRLAEAPEPTWSEQCAVDVVIAAPGYPGTVTTGGTITGIEIAEELDDVHVLHAGTGTTERGELVAVGGRVLSVVALGATLEAARERAYEAVERINLEGAQYRTDIAQAASEGSVGSVGSAASADGAE